MERLLAHLSQLTAYPRNLKDLGKNIKNIRVQYYNKVHNKRINIIQKARVL